MRKNLKKAMFGIASALVILVNVLAPNQVNARSFVSAREVKNSSPANSPAQEQIVPALVVIAVVFVVVATVRSGGAQLTNNDQTNLNNLDY